MSRRVVQGESEPHFTRREREVFNLFAKGLPAPEIARHLGISSSAVRQHVANIRRKGGFGRGRAPDRLRGGPDAPGGAGWHVAGGGPTAIGHIESPRRMASQWSRRLTTRWPCCNVPNPSAAFVRGRSKSPHPWTGGHLAQREGGHGEDQDESDRDSRDDQGLPLDDEVFPLHACLYRRRTTVALARPSPPRRRRLYGLGRAVLGL